MKYTVLPILLLLLILSCKKGATDFEITGRIYDSSHGTYLANATLLVYKTDAGADEAVYYGGVVTDSEGRYTLKITRDRFVSLQFILDDYRYYELKNTVNFEDLTTKEPNVYDYTVTGKSWIKIHLVNSITPSPGSHLSIKRTEGKEACSECCPSYTRHFYGEVDTTIYCINNANSTYAFDYHVIGLGITGNKSAVTPFYDTVLVELEY